MLIAHAAAAGVGLVFPTELGRLEANYCWVLPCPALWASSTSKSQCILCMLGSAAMMMHMLHTAAAAAAAAAAGVGLVFPTQLGRLEANYCWVLTSQEHDRLRRGFSFGFAANMGL
jgi:hypothetical protein